MNKNNAYHLQSQINKISDNLITLTLNEYNSLIKLAVQLYEMGAVVFLYDSIKENNLQPSSETYAYINKLHSKTVLNNSTIKIPIKNTNSLKSRRRIHKIMKGYYYSKALKNKDIVINYLKNNEYNYDGKDKKKEKMLINLLKLECKLPVSDIRHILTYLKRQKYFTK